MSTYVDRQKAVNQYVVTYLGINNYLKCETCGIVKPVPRFVKFLLLKTIIMCIVCRKKQNLIRHEIPEYISYSREEPIMAEVTQNLRLVQKKIIPASVTPLDVTKWFKQTTKQSAQESDKETPPEDFWKYLLWVEKLHNNYKANH